MDYTEDDFTESGEKHDVTSEAVGNRSKSSRLRTLKKERVIIHLIVAPAVRLRMKWASITADKKMVVEEAVTNIKSLNYHKELLKAGEVRLAIDRRYQFEQIIKVHGYVDTGHKKVAKSSL
ncbi:MAG: zinc-binding dehydrogenase [Candidatus Saliniplasma sp.]